MGQCYSDFDVKSYHSGTSLPPTLSVSASRVTEIGRAKNDPETISASGREIEIEIGRAKPGNSLSYSPPVLTPRHRNVLVSKEVFTSLSPPQSPDIVVPFRVPLPEEEMPPMKNEENSSETAFGESILTSEESSKRAFTESIFIDVIDIQSKLPVLPGIIHSVVEKTSAAEKTDQMVSPPVPFQKQKVCNRDLASNNTNQLVLQAPEVEQKDAKTTEPAEPISQMITADGGEAKIEATFKCTLRVMFACYIIGITFFSLMCRNAFTQQEVSNVPVLNEMDFLPAPAPDMKRKDRFHFLHEMKQNVAHLGEFSMQRDAHALLPLNGMKQLLSENTVHAVETIQTELEAIHEIVLI